MALGRNRGVVLLAVAFALVLRLSPMSVYNATVLLLGNTCGSAWSLVRAVPAPTPPLKAAILNVTSDFDQLAFLVADFMQQPGMDPKVQRSFKEYLAQRATRSYPRLESLLDWLLASYKFAFPFLIISLAARRGGSREQGSDATAGCEPASDDAQLALEPAATRHADGPLQRSNSAESDQVPSLQAALQQRQLASSSVLNGFAKHGGRATGRAGSQSPRGPETPVDGGGARFPPHPTAMRPTAGSKLPGQRQRRLTANEVDTEYSF